MSGALAGLQSDLASLKAGMKRIALPTQSYQHASLPLSAERLLNFYIETETAEARSQAALMPTPGLTVDQVYGAGPILAMNSEEPGRLYVASGTEFYRQRVVLSGTFIDDLGPIGSPATDVLPQTDLMVTIAVGPTACVVCVPPNAFTCTHDGALNQISGGFPGAATVAYLDGYFIFTSYENSAQFFISALLDPTMYSALDFAYSDGLTNVIRRAFIQRGELWLMGEAGTSVWYDTGLATTVGGVLEDFPFLPRPGANIPYPVATPHCIAKGDSSVFWVGLDGIVYRSNGYQAVRISTHAIEILLQRGNPAAITGGLVHSEGGHIFYVFTLTGQTYAYDCATQKWHNRSSSSDGTQRWLPNTSAVRGNFQLLGDSTNGNVYFTDSTSGADNGQNVFRQLITPPIWAGTNRAFMNRLEIEMEVGGLGPGDVVLEWSNDGGWTWVASRTLFTGLPADRDIRVVTTRLGSFHQRCFRLTAIGLTKIYAIDCDITSPQAGG